MNLRQEIDRLCATSAMMVIGLSDGTVLRGVFRADESLNPHDDAIEFQASSITGPAEGHLRGHCVVPLAAIAWIDHVR